MFQYVNYTEKIASRQLSNSYLSGYVMTKSRLGFERASGNILGRMTVFPVVRKAAIFTRDHFQPVIQLILDPDLKLHIFLMSWIMIQHAG